MVRSSLLLFVLTAGTLTAEPVALVEKSSVDRQFRVFSEMTMKGELLTPATKDKPSERIKLSGNSYIEYAERGLAIDPKEADFKSLRVYDKIDFRKLTNDRTDEITLRPAVRRLVMMKRGRAKVPFSPDGPLTWGEIDMLRTDIVVPALAGMLPEKPVEPGATWKAGERAVVELTDLDKIESGSLECKFDRVAENGPRKLAVVTFAGTVVGVNEDGPTRQALKGKLYVDLGSEGISYLEVEGEQSLLDDKGAVAGKITGTYKLIRTPMTNQDRLGDPAIKSLNLIPGEANTRLLFDNDDAGVRFIYPRRWRVVRTTGRQIAIDETNGNGGLLITLDQPGRVPLTADFVRETLKELQERMVKLESRRPLKVVAAGLDHFGFDMAESDKEQVTMDYWIARQANGGATMAARLTGADKENLLKEIETIAKSFTVVRKLGEK